MAVLAMGTERPTRSFSEQATQVRRPDKQAVQFSFSRRGPGSRLTGGVRTKETTHVAQNDYRPGGNHCPRGPRADRSLGALAWRRLAWRLGMARSRLGLGLSLRLRSRPVLLCRRMLAAAPRRNTV